MASNMALIARRVMKLKIPNIPTLKANREMSTLRPALKDKMGRYGLEDGTPVYIKGGSKDSMVYRFTMALCVGSLALIGTKIFILANK